MKRYNPAEIEEKWRKNWARDGVYVAKDFSGFANLAGYEKAAREEKDSVVASAAKKSSKSKKSLDYRGDESPRDGKKPVAKKFVMLTEFPYPSGAGLHMGHLREYTLGDIIARYHRMHGENVLFPMGYDAFGLPTENFAIKNKISPQTATAQNTAHFREQLDAMGYSIDWSRSFATSDPNYYKWTQWLWLRFFKKGLAYQAEIAINWCPFCKTGLANEEVVNGRHERCDNLVEKKVKKQWMLRITDYAERLIDGLATVDYSPRIAKQQVDWIGKKTGIDIDYEVTNSRKISGGNSRKRDEDSPEDLAKNSEDFATPEFGTPAPNEVEVEGAVIVGYNPRKDEFLAIETGVGNLTWHLASGGREDGETYLENARRELRGETGFDVSPDKFYRLDKNLIASHYYNSIKKSHRKSLATAFLAIIDDEDSAGEGAREEYEKDFRNIWLKFDKLYDSLAKGRPDSDHWLYILDLARELIDNNFSAKTGGDSKKFAEKFGRKFGNLAEKSGANSPKNNFVENISDETSREIITVFTTRPDTNFGATFLALAPEHEFVQKILDGEIEPADGDSHREAIANYVRAAMSKSEIERQEEGRQKTGVFTGFFAKNALTGRDMPIWVSDFVLAGFGTGAVVGVPGHDLRDFQFAKEFDLPIVQVVAVEETPSSDPPRAGKKNTERDTVDCLVKHPTEDKYLTLKWPKHGWHNLIKGGIESGETPEEAARREIIEETGYINFKYLDTMPLVTTSKFYAAHKDVNRDITTTVISFQLENLERQLPDLDEIEKAEDFKTVWVSRDELKKLSPQGNLSYILDWLDGKSVVNEEEGIMINSDFLNGLNIHAATEKMMDYMEEHGMGRRVVNYRLRDWIFSRQHYWGEPIPIIHCAKCGAVAVPDEDLPVELPPVDHYEPTDDGESPLSRIPEFVNVKCPKCGKSAKRETDTMPNWAGSNWYYLRYFDARNDQKFADPDKLKYWGMVDLYLGGMEHTTLHLLYSRFHHQFLFDQGLVPTPEPYAARRGQGIVLAADGRKMSKSLGNVVDPTEIINSGYGADAARLAVAFLAPYDQTTPWSPETVVGCYKFLGRVWNLAQEIAQHDAKESDQQALEFIHRAIQKVTDDIDKLQFNTAIASLMETLNNLTALLRLHFDAGEIAPQRDGCGISREDFAKFVQLLAPFAPHLAEEIWREILGHRESIHLSNFPLPDAKYLAAEQITLAIQVNGKLRGEISVAPDELSENIENLALAQENVAKFVQGKTVAKVIYVPGKIVNVVAK